MVLVQLIFAHLSAHVAAQNATTPAPTQALQPSLSVNITVVVVGVILVFALFAFSFYFTVLWPKRAMLEYRRRFELLVNEDIKNTDEKQLKIDPGTNPLYSGAAPVKLSAAQPNKVPTYQEIEKAKILREKLRRTQPESHAASNFAVDL